MFSNNSRGKDAFCVFVSSQVYVQKVVELSVRGFVRSVQCPLISPSNSYVPETVLPLCVTCSSLSLLFQSVSLRLLFSSPGLLSV